MTAVQAAPDARSPAHSSPAPILDVLIVGAGPAGLGLALVLRELGLLSHGILERDRIGASFLRWPEEMRFITPSFNANAFGQLDLNAINAQTSPADLIGRERLSGPEYAGYLGALVKHYGLPVVEGIEVEELRPGADGGFDLTTSRGPLRARFVVWATGEFQFPRFTPFPGGELCQHTATIRRYADLLGEERLILGGYESAIDAAVNLAERGVRVRVLSDRAPWLHDAEWDPSVTLSPASRERLTRAQATGRVELLGDVRVTRVAYLDASGYHVHAQDDRAWTTTYPPLLATGFNGGTRQLAGLFEHAAEGHPLLTAHDESQKTPGLFLVGPQVRHEKIIFCFIYKYRQRFAVVAAELGRRLGLDLAPLDAYRTKGLYLDDLSCCLARCDC
jgi:thioredoxin reductase